MIADLKDRPADAVTPFVIVNFSHHEHLHLPKDHVVAFAEKDSNEGEVLEICTMEQLEKEIPRNWIPSRKRQEKMNEFFENPFMTRKDDFVKSPAEVPVHRKVLLEDRDISPKTQKAFDKLCEKYDDIISKNSGDIGKTMLVEMEIETGNHPPIASKPYTLPLKHYEWVQKEIETLERAGIIERSISPWASPVVIVPKKSAQGEPLRRRMCVDYRKLNKLQPEVTNADIEFKWTPECEKCFQILKEFLKQAPILRYPDPQASYTLYTDASKYAYAGVLTQHNDGVDHPITYVSGLFRGSQLNWATLTKEAYAIYMSIKKLSFYIHTAKITVRSDHLPLKKFLEKNTMNSKVNNWAVELESQNITFEYIPGIKNTLADTLSRLIDIDENIRLQPEEEGKEFSYFPFEELPPAQTQMVETISIGETGTLSIHHTDPVETNTEV